MIEIDVDPKAWIENQVPQCASLLMAKKCTSGSGGAML